MHTNLLQLILITLTLLLLCVGQSLAFEEKKCPNEKDFHGSQLTDEQLNKIGVEHRQWLTNTLKLSLPLSVEDVEASHAIEQAIKEGNVSGRAVLCNLNLSHRSLDIDLTAADLRETDFTQSHFISYSVATQSSLSHLVYANFEGACLQRANLFGVNAQGASFRGADLTDATLFQSDLFRADLTKSLLSRTNVAGAKFTEANLTDAFYSPSSDPPNASLEQPIGLTTMRFFIPWSIPHICGHLRDQGNPKGLVQLQKIFKEAGTRQSEREVTFAIEHGKTILLLRNQSHESRNLFYRMGMLGDLKSYLFEEQDWPDLIEGIARLLFFEWPSGYDLHPFRPLVILAVFSGLCAFAYYFGIRRSEPLERSALYKVLAKDRPGYKYRKFTLLEGQVTKVPHVEAISTAIWFSALSAFHIGFRELSLGTWLTRLQKEEYTLVARGWMRQLSGFQSIISVYLLGLTALTYFTRIFGNQ